jgi:hypothetical protein
MLHKFVYFSFHDLYQFGKLQMVFGTMVKIAIQTLQNVFDVTNQSYFWKGLYHNICLMSHTRHTDDKWNVLISDLDCRSWFKALEGVDWCWPIIDFFQKPLGQLLIFFRIHLHARYQIPNFFYFLISTWYQLDKSPIKLVINKLFF